MNIEDLRGEQTRVDANAHTAALERIVAAHERSALRRTAHTVMGLATGCATTALAGCAAGYTVTGDAHAAAQWAEIATAYWMTVQAGITLPLRVWQGRLAEKTRRLVEDERRRAHRAAEQGDMHLYEPKIGVAYENHPLNPINRAGERIKERYSDDLVTTYKPIRRLISNVALSALGTWFASTIVDGETNIIDAIGPNPVQHAMDAVHYVGIQVDALRPYLDAPHAHLTDLSQSQMWRIGVGLGVITTARQYITGMWRRAAVTVRR